MTSCLETAMESAIAGKSVCLRFPTPARALAAYDELRGHSMVVRSYRSSYRVDTASGGSIEFVGCDGRGLRGRTFDELHLVDVEPNPFMLALVCGFADAIHTVVTELL